MYPSVNGFSFLGTLREGNSRLLAYGHYCYLLRYWSTTCVGTVIETPQDPLTFCATPSQPANRTYAL